MLAGAEVVAIIELLSAAPRDDGAHFTRLIGYLAAQLGSVLRRKLAEESLHAAEAQLRQAQKMEAIGRLAGGVAHDFNNLLTAILGYAEMILARLGDGDPLREDLEEIAAAGRRAAALTRQLLLFSRSEAVIPRVLDPNAVIGELERMVRRLLGASIELQVALAPGLGRARMDRGHLEQVVLNLCVNARDAMASTGGRLLIETANVQLERGGPGDAAPGRYVQLVVSDTGCGMGPEVLAHIFEPFFTTKGPGQGTGLGLSTVYGIVKGAGGHIQVESGPGRGARFTAREGPDVLVVLDEQDRLVRPRPPRGLLRRRRRGDRLVDPREALHSSGYRVVVAASGAEAEQICQQAGAIDLLVTDVIMPRMSGPELARRVLAVRPGLKVLFVSGYTSGAVPEAQPGSPQSFLQKPFTPASLTRTVRALLDAP